ncbi:hypothetical protein PHYSODRAFT_524237 [Phytophthora sojae]|uniref:Sfi1 spindle body domain-containing protein n=1 Tax=Phytophthora sojae (strain P6497) TaxID=1094619 RepID=G5A5V2_PHYSP|nr:hypothetical protein PHYSODRAFT_524237 [Phytophthora sojae]EGZ08707.1 hypothetical protein PHYSODRAFT_524237 [Phytophthora sojae]|eukprot:XP_009535340.1 hypothetical protein PHYSODRAFT_524237 [Phytophthora sojae]
MWSHAATRIRLAHVFTSWIALVQTRRGQSAVAATMHRMQQLRSRQKVFTSWAVLATAGRLASHRDTRESLRWRRRCWAHWKLWRVSSRWRRCQQLLLLQSVFCQGLRRHAIQQQAFREVCLRTARGLLHRSLARWRVEWWLVRSQRKLGLDMKRNALAHWKTFVAARRQQRRWEHYVQQLHRVQTRSKAAAFDKTRRSGGTFRDTRALQAQLKRNRVLMTHVLHAWFLVVQNRRRPLEFWAHGVMHRCFYSWRKQTDGKPAELA